MTSLKAPWSRNVSLRPYTTYRAGGPAEWLTVARTADELAKAVIELNDEGSAYTILGWGSNVLPSDAGVPGATIVNGATQINIGLDGLVEADSGCGFQELFLKTAQAGLEGLSFAVGIPGTLGGALVSNAGAYRRNIADFIQELDVVVDGVRRWVGPEIMEFGYRDSVLRRSDPPRLAIIRVRLKLAAGNQKAIFDEARAYQIQRIAKQPPMASVGSFFKNVVEAELAPKITGLTDGMRSSGVIPAGFLIEAVGLKGKRKGGAMFGERHANFILNVRGATANDIRSLADLAKKEVLAKYGVQLEEEALYLGDWSHWKGSLNT